MPLAAGRKHLPSPMLAFNLLLKAMFFFGLKSLLVWHVLVSAKEIPNFTQLKKHLVWFGSARFSSVQFVFNFVFSSLVLLVFAIAF